jgi:hypothetical protein
MAVSHALYLPYRRIHRLLRELIPFVQHVEFLLGASVINPSSSSQLSLARCHTPFNSQTELALEFDISVSGTTARLTTSGSSMSP